MPAITTPSEAPTATAADRAVSWKAEDYCSSQILISGGDAKELGSIYHAMIAWACSNPGILDDERAIADFLSRQDSPLSFDAEALRISLKAGRIDLLIRTAYGLVVMNHKLAGNSDGKVEEIVATWAPQLALYARAIALVSGKPPVGTWLNLPLEGSAVRGMGGV